MPQDQLNTTYLVTLSTEDVPTYQVTAAYATVDERLFPGFVILKDQSGSIVALIPAAALPVIRRADSDPTLPKRPAPKATPAQLGRLAAHGSKPGDV